MATDMIDFAPLFESDEHFCLKVRGDSMIEDHIIEGDYVIVRKQPTARNGQMVVAVPDGEERPVLRRYYRGADAIRLQPSNLQMDATYHKTVEIRGVVTGVIRQDFPASPS